MKRLLFVFALLLSPSVFAQPFDGLSEAIEQGSFGNLKAVIIAQHGEIIYEDYFRGTQADTLHQVQSVTKSVGSALVGIAHRQGKIRLDQDLNYFFSGLYDMSQPEFQNKAGITVEQILQQRHGIEWDEDSTDYRDPLNPVGQMIESEDWYRYVLGQPVDAVPGAKFSYSSGASTLMSRMIRVASGMGPDAFAMQQLFGPMAIENVHWEIYSEQGMGTGITDWPNPDDDVTLAFSLWLTARDMLKIGQLYLDGGVYNGQRILDEAWVDASWTRYSHSGNSSYFPDPGWGHGYQWWIARLGDLSGREFSIYFASGWGSQVIFIVPDLGLVVVTTADNYDFGGPDVDALLVTRILPELTLQLDSRFSGSWYDPASDGQGFSMEVRAGSETVVAYWYTYTADGEKRWFVLQGEVIDGVGEVTIYQTSGGVFLQGDPVVRTVWGTGSFSAVDCRHMEFAFESAELSASIPLTRITGECAQRPE
ncbi:MAG: serine hydrolase [Xanthomonadales bacterium]|nr:beta-lactamase family protein [Gammaproteobacteria bacterium]MBT8053635.1 beta-lactamase family protein [Gammaproteobacteria bacterium]NND58587.1 serine hydrolase [Xanthomonadales bacterium]